RTAAEFEGDGRGGRRPHGERGDRLPEDRAEFGGGRVLPVQVVQNPRCLYAGRGEEGTIGGPLGGDDLAAQGLADAVAITRVDREGRIVLQMRELGLLRVA